MESFISCRRTAVEDQISPICELIIQSSLWTVLTASLKRTDSKHHLQIRLIRFLCSNDFDSQVILDWTVELLCEDS